MWFFAFIIELSRHILSGYGVLPDYEKVISIAKLAVPTNIHTLCSFLGCYDYYVCFVPHYAHVSAQLTDLLATGVKRHWDQP